MRCTYMPARLIVCESAGDWAAILRRQLPDVVSLIEMRHLADVDVYLGGRVASIVAIEFKPQRAEEIFTALVKLQRQHPRTIAVVLAERGLSNWGEIVREAGAVHFIASPRRIGELVDLLRMQMKLGQFVDSLPDCLPPEDRILAGLPWPRFASSVD